ncbi:MAG TPA: AAA domain-containing protein [Cyclobacteriaceae bacterium]|nr:AAA domain-containing protein [Cyclobacteriaceae bacterium]
MEQNRILKTYLRRLTNLSGNNRSLLLLKLSAEQLIDLHKLSYLEKTNSFSILTSLIAGKSHVLCAVTDARMEQSNEVSRRLKRLQRIDQLIYEEKGSKDLHVGWPILRGKFNDGTNVRAPLVYFPVSLQQEKGKWILFLRKDAGISFNKSFLLAYAYYNQLSLDEELLDRSFEDFDTDKDVFRSSLYEVLKESNIEIDFNTDNFKDELQSFQEFSKESFEEQTAVGRIKLFPEAVIGIFPQASTQLVPDYTALLKEDQFKDLEQFFYERSPAKQTDNKISLFSPDHIKEEKLFNVFKLDAYQELAIRTVKAGNSIVVKGPPGTGKSQLICNLLSDAIANGKRVLIVCQKRAALDVVYDRMRSNNLHKFLALVHDYRNDRKEVYEKINEQIENIDRYKQQNNNIDTIQLERNYIHISRRVDQIVEELDEFRKTLFDDNACGISIKEMYLNSSPHEPFINLRQEFRYYTHDIAQEFLIKFKTYHAYASQFLQDHYLLADRKSFASYKITDLKRIKETISDLIQFQQKSIAKIYELAGIEITIEQAEELLRYRHLAVEMLGSLRLDAVYNYFRKIKGETDDETSSLWLENIERVFFDCFNNHGPEKTLQAQDLGRFQEVLQKSIMARKSLVRLLRWELFSKDKFLIKRVMVANQIPNNKQGFNRLVMMIDNRLNLEHNITKLKSKIWLTDFPTGYDQNQWEQWFKKQKLALRAKLIYSYFESINITIDPLNLDFKDFKNAFEELFELLREIPERKTIWENYLSNLQINKLLRQPNTAEGIIRQLDLDFEALSEFDRINDSLAEHEKITIDRLYDLLGPEVKYEDFKKVFINSNYLAWIEHLETKYPVLRSVSTLRISQLETELQELVQQKQSLSTDIVLMRARERVYEEVEFNRLRNRVTYRDLKHQVTKKRRIWPVRKVVNAFDEELFRLIPCWLASPETVSALFPMKSFFDYVIFDEASQCFAERGIPAMYRGKQVIIAGDDKQLRPFDLYQLRWDEIEEELPETELDSLLDLSARYLMQVQLQSHYRSNHPALIAFSNKHFYKNELKLIPHKSVINDVKLPIDYIKVEGVWEKNVNEAEANKVVELVEILRKSNPDKSIGIISFNSPQQMLIIDLLENYFADKRKEWPQDLMVKNIENVQGDEKDIIIFSLGYAAGKSKKLMMQFGSLNVQGGENRLNVAITRAREKIIVVSSIYPHELKTDDIKNDGPKLLKAYLQFAYDLAQGTYEARPLNQPKHQFNWYLSSRIINLLNANYAAFTFGNSLMPQTDIEIRQNKKHVSVILTDDDFYHAAQSGKEAHAYIPLQLKERSWPNLRVFSREWWFNKEKLMNQLGGFISEQVRD